MSDDSGAVLSVYHFDINRLYPCGRVEHFFLACFAEYFFCFQCMEAVHTSFFSVDTRLFSRLFFAVEQDLENVHGARWQCVLVSLRLFGKRMAKCLSTETDGKGVLATCQPESVLLAG